MKCTVCGNERSWVEIITKGITQKITYLDGFIVKEETEYDNNEGVAKCVMCGKLYEEYDL